jgi:hypothetical protein
MDQNRRPRHKPTQLQLTHFDKGVQTHNGEKTASTTDVAWKSGYPYVED